MRLLLALLLTLLAPCGPLLAQDRSFLFEPQRFQAALTQLLGAVGKDPRLALLVADDDEIALVARISNDPPQFSLWTIRDVVVLGLHTNKLQDPEPVEPTRLAVTPDRLFAPGDIPLDQLPRIVALAAKQMPFEYPPRSGQVVIQHPKGGTLGWIIELSNGAEQAAAVTDPQGNVLATDISGTRKWADRYFMTQDDWPFAEAGPAFAAVAGTGPEVRKIVVTPQEITLTATLPGQPGKLGTWTWDGSRPRAKAVPTPTASASAASLPGFALADIDLGRLPDIRRAALAAIGPDALIAAEMRLIAVADQAGMPRAQWQVDIKVRYTGKGFPKAEVATVLLTPDGRVASKVSAEEKRALDDQTLPAPVVAAITSLRGALGDEARVFDIYFRQDRVSITQLDPSDPDMTIASGLDGAALKPGSPFPRMMMSQGDEDLFPLGALAGIDAALIEAIRARAVAAMGIDGGVVYRMSLSSGAPFRRDSKGRPFFDVRVGVPPGFHRGGYAVFTVDGTLVDAIK